MEKSNINRYFEEFGEKMYILAILSVISIFTGGIVQLAMFIILLISLKHIKEANLELNNEKLENFRKYIIYSVITGIIGGILTLIIGIIILVFLIQFVPIMPITSPLTVAEFQAIAPLIQGLLVVGMIAVLVATIAIGILMSAWNNLNIFFKNYSDIFPNDITNDAIEGSGKIKNSYLLIIVSLLIGAILVLISIILFPQIIELVSEWISGTTPPLELVIGLAAAFLIPGIIAGVIGLISFILMVLGYFKLSSLRKL